MSEPAPTKTRRWVDSVVELWALRLVLWVTVVTSSYPGILLNPFKLASWFDDHLLYAFDEVDRVTLLRYGQLPAWNPFWCGGASGIAEPEDSFYSPDFLLRLVFGSEHGRRLALVLFFVLGLEGTYRLARRLDASAIAAAFAAVVFATFDKFVSFIHDGWVHFLSFELIPWVLLALVNGVRDPRWRVGGAFFLAWMVLAPGTYSTPYTAVAFLYVITVMVGYRLLKGDAQPFRGPLLSAVTIGVLAFLLCACKLVPTTLYMSKFTRVFTPVETHTVPEALGWLVPRYSVIVFFALVGVVFGDFAAGVCVGGALLFFMLSLGDYGALSPFHVMKKLPLLSQLRFPDRFVVMVVFFLALAASRGLTRAQDVLPGLVRALWTWGAGLQGLRLRVRPAVRRVLGRELPWREVSLARDDEARGDGDGDGDERAAPSRAPRELIWLAVGLSAFGAWRVAYPSAVELASAQRGPSMGLYVDEAPRAFEQPFKQHRGNRRDAHVFPWLNMGSLNCVAGIPIPESSRLRGDLPAEEYPADPAIATVKRVSWSPNVIVLDVDAKAATSVYVNQNWAPEWRVNAGVVRSEQGLLTVDVPAGHTTLRLEYRDYILYVSLLISLGTALTIAWLGGRRLVRAVRAELRRYESLPLLPPGPPATPEEPSASE